MPVIDFTQPSEFTTLITWKLQETNTELLSLLNLKPERQKKYESLTDKRKREYLGLRACLNRLGLNEMEVLYDEKGKPFIREVEHELSITHSYEMVSVGISEFDIGIDIELQRTDKIQNIRKKFIREDEELWLAKKENINDYLHIIWGIKEGLYKLNGGNLWNFLHHYKIEPFDLKEEQPINSWISDEQASRKYFSYYKKIENYYLIWVLDYE